MDNQLKLITWIKRRSSFYFFFVKSWIYLPLEPKPVKEGQHPQFGF